MNIGGRGLGVVAVDLNGDAQPDIVVVDNQNNRVAVALATGPRAVRARHSSIRSAEEPGGITSGDFNGDGRPDLAVSARSDRCRAARRSVLTQNAKAVHASRNALSSQRASAAATDVEETPIGIAALDSNCDGRDDLVVANLARPTPCRCCAAPPTAPSRIVQTLPEAQVGQGPISLAVADFNRDGVADFAVSNSVVPRSSSESPDRSTATARPARSPSARHGPRRRQLVSAIVARDFTGDQIVDIGVVNQTSNAVRISAASATAPSASDQSDSVSRMPIAIAAGGFRRATAVTMRRTRQQRSQRQQRLGALQLRPRPGCDPFRPAPRRAAPALRGDGNNDGVRSAADFVAVAAEVMDGDGKQVEAIAHGDLRRHPRVAGRRRERRRRRRRRRIAVAVAHRIFGGA